ncbi:uncharacterized protein LOC116928016 isoform X1 [Daphnia magna]|uniref:uncharacterized protein LOC116928016 isoform X1 n=2 Tax=Daphnia magna TaxID=35525 RepID=UPI001403500C|nr:uncharacterized protein LOC116928016 isoform X1 [Daphnia magna]XP_032790957.1 uncharacterized protein LOC116928016 isoform X1 [Daphnia magna]
MNSNIFNNPNLCQRLMTVIAITTLLYMAVWHMQSPFFHYNSIQITDKEDQRILRQISPTCNCNDRETVSARQQQSLHPNTLQWCSSQSSQRGTHQNVIAYTIFGNVTELYYSLLTNISSTAQKFYPGWIVRIYHNFRNQSVEAHRQLCNVYCQFRNVDLCSVPQLIERIRNTTENNQLERIEAGLLERLNLRMFRYLVAFDPNVDIFISRDVDSIIWQREVDAVEQWLQSNYTFHVMRDHNQHSVVMLAGMWGAKLYQRRDLMVGMMRAIISAGQDQVKITDQVTLRNIVWPSAQYDAMVHDSYHCQNSVFMAKTLPMRVYPFPTQRRDGHFVGGVGQQKNPAKCPEACRPPDHKDWEYC